MLKTMLRNIKRWKRNRRVLFAWLNLMLFVKRTGGKRNTKKNRDQILTFFFPYKSNK